MSNYFSGKETRASVLIGIFLLLIILYPIFRLDSGQVLFQNNPPLQPKSSSVADLDFSALRVPPFTTLQENVVIDYGQQYEAQVSATLEPAPPYDVRALDMEIGKTLSLDWLAPHDSAISGFRIYRSNKQYQNGELIAEIPDRNQTFYYDASLTNNQRYYYVVRSLTKDRLESSNTDQVVGIPTDSSPPAAPTHVAFRKVAGEGKIEISWKNPSDDDFSFVRVYRSDQSGQLGTMVVENITDEQFVDTVNPSQTYYYAVTAVDTSGNESVHDLPAGQMQRNIFEDSAL